MANTNFTHTKKVKHIVRPDGTQEYAESHSTKFSRKTSKGQSGITALLAKCFKKGLTFVKHWLKSKFNS